MFLVKCNIGLEGARPDYDEAARRHRAEGICNPLGLGSDTLRQRLHIFVKMERPGSRDRRLRKSIGMVNEEHPHLSTFYDIYPYRPR